MNNPFSPSADRNKEPILQQLRQELSPSQSVLEIGSGTGQHACHFANAMPDIVWQPTELKHNIPTIQSWMTEHKLPNILEPIALNVDIKPWPEFDVQVCYTCNTLHIVGMESVRSIFTGSKQVLGNAGKLCVYGPFAIAGKHTSEGNVQFDQQLRTSDPASGIRDLTKIDTMAQEVGFLPCRYRQMPANNLFVVWEIEASQTEQLAT